MSRMSYRGWRGRLVSALLPVLYGLSANVAAEDDNRWMFRFETTFGGKQNHQRLDFVAGAPGDWNIAERPDGGYTYRVPLYTTSSSEWAVFRAETANGEAGSTLGTAGLVAGFLVFYVALPIYALTDEIDDAKNKDNAY